ncbi:TraR/DksA family transcriptional regulator [Aggregatilinea lenta]|uniref:TraR/DksA family transcriptional regulator n=1 Tax=Aggregatilinea lenta TaxID=913108 RepID=UPI001EE8DA8F|nr:TraR/DksA C4-type zinc finger protein [Aggregatilinea lenta]
MTTTKTELHDVLVSLYAELEQTAQQLEEADEIDDPGTGYTNHQADDATIVFDQTVNASTLYATRTRLRQVDDALARHAAGTYGICTECGTEIDIARLEAIPYTPLCLRCAEARDYRARV